MSGDPILISLFNHKGGVSKTTTTFNLGWTFAQKGVRTLIVDADPQCNLTAYVLGLQQHQDLTEFYSNTNNDNIYAKIEPIISGSNSNPQSLKPCKTLNDNLLLAAGHLSMSDLDISLSTGITSGRFLPFAKQFIGAFQRIIRRTAESQKCSLVLVDMSPNAGAMNRSILMSSDYFIIPTSPDFFSFQSIQTLGEMLPRWNHDFTEFRDSSVTNHLPQDPPRMLGIISQKYRPYTKKIKEGFKDYLPFSKSDEKQKQGIAKSYQLWIDKIQRASSEVLTKSLSEHDMVISEETLNKFVQDESPYNLISIGDFNSLIALSQEHSKPIFELTDDELNFSGKVLEEMKKNQIQFKQIFFDLADKIINLIDADYAPRKSFKQTIFPST